MSRKKEEEQARPNMINLISLTENRPPGSCPSKVTEGDGRE
jgi:hypothetical protein